MVKNTGISIISDMLSGRHRIYGRLAHIRRAAAAVLAVTAGLLVCGCDPHGMSVEQFSSTEKISLQVKGSVMLEYSPERHQLGFNPGKCEFRVHDDNMADYFILTCRTMPTAVGQTVTADLVYTTADDVATRRELEFEVTDMDEGDGRIWLWCSKAKIGIVVMAMR